jgi:predicted dehydrogenase
VFSRDVDDEIYCSLSLKNGVKGQLVANWSDESQRKMSTKVSVWGENGCIKADRQECAVYLREGVDDRLRNGWTVLNTTELTDDVWFYLRGEEYSAQLDEFVRRIRTSAPSSACDFRAGLETDRVVAMINGDQPASGTLARPAARTPLQTFLSVLRGSHG